MRTYIWIAQVRVWVVACFEQFIWTMHFEINKNFRFRNSSHRFSIWKPHSTIMPAPAHHRSNVFFWRACISVATAYLLIRWQHAFYVHFASGTNLLLIFPQCECMHCGLPFQFNHWHTGDNCATNTTTPSCLPPHHKILLSMSNETNLLRWLIRAIIGTAIPFDVSNFHSLLCVRAISIFDENFNATKIII